MTPTQYFNEALSQFHSLASFHKDQLSIADRLVRLNTPSANLRNLFLPSLAHLIIDVEDDNAPELTIWYAEQAHLPKKLTAPIWDGFNAQGYNSSIDEDDVQLFFQPWQKQVFLYSKSKNVGIYWVRSAEDVPWWECTFSFRIIFHLWTEALPSQLVHAGAMAKNGVGILIPGQSGSGKSTSCLNLLRNGYNYLGDDYVWVEIGAEIKVFSLYQTAKIEPENLDKRFADWKPFIVNKAEYLYQKAVFNVNDLFPKACISVSTISAILLPKVAHQIDTVFRKANPTQALMAMAPTTLHHLPHNRQNAYQKMMRISAALPSYHWDLGFDEKQFITSFNDFIENEFM
ncbi:hypothetical protein EZJ43_08225 [Pedobacter changchengzhani]|uniref:Serine kinase n=1 Tax=Pedobacter changchengzhani TaxID=2529274 RepID=A0A4R5MLC7_9SPHI|nr:hypothetical protein [Pedobacter changchengzhani]TDG36494.1 hypothetical protein EZJ43_08225 [Pedobacter changchengzhani]